MEMIRIFLILLMFLNIANSATYYVNNIDGSDGNNGLGPDASHASNKPWKSLSKPLRTNAIVGGDRIIAYGRFNETIQFRSNWLSVVTLSGDSLNASGFKSASGVLLSPALPMITAYTNDQALPITSASVPLFDYDGYWNFRLENFVCLSGDRGLVFEIDTKSGAGAPGRVSTNCYWSNIVARTRFDYVISIAGQSNVSQGLYFDRCDFETQGGGGQTLSVLWWANDSGSDWDMQLGARNCRFATRVNVAVAGAKFNAGNGIVASGFRFTNCTIVGGGGRNIYWS